MPHCIIKYCSKILGCINYFRWYQICQNIYRSSQWGLWGGYVI
jgi:hypothetical protein